MYESPKTVLAALAAGVVTVVPGLPAGAETTITTIATGLNSPRGLDFAANGALYVAEAGLGGPGDCFPGPDGDPVCPGTTGSVTRIWRGEQERVVEGLPSVAGEDGSAAIGPQDVSTQGGNLFIPVGLGADPREFDPALGFATLVRANPNGNWRIVSDLGRLRGGQQPRRRRGRQQRPLGLGRSTGPDRRRRRRQ